MVNLPANNSSAGPYPHKIPSVNDQSESLPAANDCPHTPTLQRRRLSKAQSAACLVTQRIRAAAGNAIPRIEFMRTSQL